jgi:CspA family cold shock protein
MRQSTVKWFDAKKGFGFIDHPDDGNDVFVHYSQIVSEKDFKTLRTGQAVEFELSDGPKGLHALDVTPTEPETPQEESEVGEDDGSQEAASQEAASQEAASQEAASQEAASNGKPPHEETPQQQAAPAAEAAPEESTEEEEDDDDWEWEEEWTDEHGNPPDPMAGPTF